MGCCSTLRQTGATSALGGPTFSRSLLVCGEATSEEHHGGQQPNGAPINAYLIGGRLVVKRVLVVLRTHLCWCGVSHGSWHAAVE